MNTDFDKDRNETWSSWLTHPFVVILAALVILWGGYCFGRWLSDLTL
jgi:hypothetical protein